MPSLESPIVTLGGLFMLGNSDRGRQFTGGETGKGLLAGGFAAGSAQYVVDEIRSQAGLDSTALSDELAQALLGAALSRFGDPIPQNNAMARGIHYNVAEQAFTEAGFTLGAAIGDVTGGGGTSSAPSSGGSSGMTHAGSGGMNDVEVF